MNDPWYSASAINHGESGAIDFQACAGLSSPWFEGHFPGEPILPGIAQISIIWDSIRKNAGHDAVITEVKRLRFRRIVRPGEELSVAVEPDKNKKGQYAFKITAGGELVCNGVMVTADSAGPGN